jgi:DNA-directed RNA polymerase sigma subunit (sigma70/sigma32)
MTMPVFDGLKPIRTHKEVAEILGVSDQAISNIERTALRKCHRILVEWGLSFEDLQPDRDRKGHGQTEDGE